MFVEDPPFNEKSTFVTTKNIFILVFCPPVTQPVMAHALLNFPARKVSINQHVTRVCQCSARAVYHDQPFTNGINLLAELAEFVAIKKFIQVMTGKHAEYAIVGQVTRQ
ncbi:hypothetical protein SDC9_204035 [bioreactor metagenome]|uniref:Uncharacterized protein n=1 Tax=bioreactor metagenome TaxID=1076179 RepID=A0A645IYV6_9ZZZZ